MFVERATEAAAWLLRDVAIREALLSSPGLFTPLERSARDVRLSLGDRAHEGAIPVALDVAVVEPLCAEGAIPDVSAKDLDVDVVRRGVCGNGAVIVRGLLDGDAVSRLRDVGRSAVEASRHPGRSMFYDPIDATWTSRDRSGLRRFVELSGGVLLADSPIGLEVLLEEYERCGILEVIRGYVGGTTLLSGAKATLRSIAPSVSADFGWHLDVAL